MERLTKKEDIYIKSDGECEYKLTSSNDGITILKYDPTDLTEIINLDKATEKLHEILEIEDELGIELTTLYRALSRGIYYKEDNHIFFTTNNIVLVSNELVQVKPTYAVKETTIKSCYYGDCEPLKYLKDAHYWDWKTCNHWKLKDYGVTWSLTKEELENE